MKVRRSRIRSVVPFLCLAALAFSACGGGGPSTEASPAAVNLLAGLNDPKDANIAVLAFLPRSVKIVTGAKVTWTIRGPEPHTVTFIGTGQPTPAPSDREATQAIGTPGPFDGSATVSSGLEPKGGAPFTFSLTFPKAGSYRYVCVVHPQMTGTINVAGAGESQAAITERGQSERDRYIAEGRAAKKKLTETPAKSQKNSDGTTTYTVEMGVGTAHTESLAFQPVEAMLKAGDRIVFVNNSGVPHTATFAGTKSLPASPDGPEAMAAAPGASPQTLNATDFFNTGWLPPNAPPGGGPPEAVRSFTFIVATAGTFDYVCLLHTPSRMEGRIVAT